MDASPTPLSSWRFSGTLRTYQREVLTHLTPDVHEKMHIVAPPGSGKTLLGLLLAAREGHRALVLAPSVTIRRQWAAAASDLSGDRAQVSEDSPADLTALTYQRLSVTGDTHPFEHLAEALWEEELVAAGRTQSDAATWLAELSVAHPVQFRRGVRSRVRRVRREFTRRRPEEIARVLHPNAVALIDALVDHGVRTVILDECHHLLDHWALVCAYLIAQVRARGERCLVIGLTATLPSPDDRTEYENYTGLLGDVDYEVPTPAVVKEGHLAPYSDHVRFTAPTPQELAFIHRHEELLAQLVTGVLTTPDGVRFIERGLVGDAAPQEAAAGDHEDRALLAAIDGRLADDFALTRACGVTLRALLPDHRLAPLLPPSLFDRATTEDLLAVLARFALTELLPDETARPQWEYVRRALGDFGYRLTDRGLRRGRDPIETTLAASAAKDDTATDILRREHAELGERLRAVVVTDFAVSGNSRGLADAEAAGAVRTFERLAADMALAALTPVLVTASTLRVRSSDAAQLATALTDHLGAPVEPIPEPGPTCALRTSAGTGALVEALGVLLTRGDVRVLVGTRALLGEGWDCPAVNTLIDLTTASTSTATQQLRGRTLRLDPAWPEKVARNHSVVCLLPPSIAIDETAEPRRLRRRFGHLWGLSADDHTSIVTGLAQALPAEARDLLRTVQDKTPGATIDALDALCLAAARPRPQVREDWRLGAPYDAHERALVRLPGTPREGAVVLVGAAPKDTVVGRPALYGAGVGAAAGLALTTAGLGPWTVLVGGAIGGALTLAGTGIRSFLRARRIRAHPAEVYLRAARAVGHALREGGRVSAFDETSLRVDASGGDDADVRIELRGTPADRRVMSDALAELFAPARTPRFLLVTGRGSFGADTFAARTVPAGRLLPVPHMIGRRRADAERFTALWTTHVGPVTLVELEGPQGLALLRLARTAPALAGRPERAEVWG